MKLPTAVDTLCKWIAEHHESADQHQQSRWAIQYQEGDDDALRRLVECNLPFCLRQAKQRGYHGVPFEDRVQAAVLGITEAAGRYDPSYNNTFLTYAWWWIRSELQEQIKRNLHVKATTRNARKYRLKRRRVEHEIQQGGKDPTLDRVAERMGLDPTECARIKGAEHPVRLDARRQQNQNGGSTTRNEGDTLRDVLKADVDDPEAIVIDEEKRSLIREFAQTLPDRKKHVFWRRADGDDTYQAIADDIGVSKQRCRQIFVDAMEQFELYVRAHHEDYVR